MQDAPKTFKILGKRWRLKLSRLRGDKHGYCDPPNKRSKTITLDTTPRRKWRVVEDIIHEVMHAGDWYKDEEWVAEFCRDLAHILESCDESGLIDSIASEE